jgi:hypothetical protein
LPDARIREEDVDAACAFLHRRDQAVEVGELRNVALNRGDSPADLLDGGIKLTLATTRDEDVSAVRNEPLCRRQANAAVAAGDEGDLSIEFAHGLSTFRSLVRSSFSAC